MTTIVTTPVCGAATTSGTPSPSMSPVATLTPPVKLETKSWPKGSATAARGAVGVEDADVAAADARPGDDVAGRRPARHVHAAPVVAVVGEEFGGGRRAARADGELAHVGPACRTRTGEHAVRLASGDVDVDTAAEPGVVGVEAGGHGRHEGLAPSDHTSTCGPATGAPAPVTIWSLPWPMRLPALPCTPPPNLGS